MGNMTEHFSRAEWACQGGGCDLAERPEPHPLLVCGLEELRRRARCPVVITSGCRCKAHNELVGGAPGSRHLPDPLTGYCEASDVVVRGMSLRYAYDLARRIPVFRRGGIGVYYLTAGMVWWLHLDVRRQTARWGELDGESRTIAAVLEAATTQRRVPPSPSPPPSYPGI